MSDPIHFHGRATPERPAIRDMKTGERYNYGQADRRVGQLAGLLRDRLGDGTGERVVVISRNSALMLLLHYACPRAGAIFVPLNWRLAPREIAALIEDAQPSMVIWQEEFDALAEPARATVDESRQIRLTDSGENLGAEHAYDPRTDIQHLLDLGAVVIPGTHNRMRPVAHRAQLRQHVMKPVRPVLPVDNQPVEPTASGQFGRAGITQANPQSDLGFTGS